MRSLFGTVASGNVEIPAVFGFDAISNVSGVSTLSSSPRTWTHTPVGIPKGVLVYVMEEASAVARVSACTYGGVAMSAVALSPQVDTHEEDSVIEAFFLGSGLPTGAQTVSVTFSGIFGSLNACAITVVGPNNSAVEDTSITNASTANPTCALTIDESSIVTGCLWTTHDNLADFTIGAGMTTWHNVDTGAQVWSAVYRAATTASNSTVDWTSAATDHSILAVAIKST